MVPEQPGAFGIASRYAPFPAIASVPLEPVRRRLFRAARRSPQDLPEHSGGTVLVFQSNNRFSLALPGPKMMSSDVVVRATGAVVVSVKQELVGLVAQLPSATGQHIVHLYATFYCLVTNPVLVLESGCFEVRPALHRHLLGDNKLRMFGAREDIVDNFEVLQRIQARTQAINELQPPAVPGMRVEFVGVTVGVYDGRWADPDDYDANPERAGVHDRYDGDFFDRPPRDVDTPPRDVDTPPRDGYAAYPFDDSE